MTISTLSIYKWNQQLFMYLRKISRYLKNTKLHRVRKNFISRENSKSPAGNGENKFSKYIFDRSIVDIYIAKSFHLTAPQLQLKTKLDVFGAHSQSRRVQVDERTRRGNSNSANIAVNRRWHSRLSVDQLDKCPKRSIDDSEPRRSRLWDLEDRLDDISINLKGTLFNDWFHDKIAQIWFFFFIKSIIYKNKKFKNIIED